MIASDTFMPDVMLLLAKAFFDALGININKINKVMKTKIIPFDLETAKKIQAGEIKGRIRSKEGDFTARIICFDKVKLVHGDGTTEKQIVSLTYNENSRQDEMYVHNQKGEVQTQFGFEHGYDLVLEVPDNEPKETQFKPFDKVLVRNDDKQEWWCAIFSHVRKTDEKYKYATNPFLWTQCIPYEGNEHLVGTTDKPKEE